MILRYALALVLLIIGVVTLNLGLNSLSDGDLPSALLWFSVMIVSLGFVSFSVLRVRRGLLPLSNTKMLSVVLCTKCSFKQMKNFALGDYVSKQEGKCTQCGNPTLFISGIYSEDLKKK